MKEYNSLSIEKISQIDDPQGDLPINSGYLEISSDRQTIR